MIISVVGMGYVGLSNALLLAQHNSVVAIDISREKIDQINNNQSPFEDGDIKTFFEKKSINLKATVNKVEAYSNAEYVIVATPTDYNPKTNYFDTSSIESVITDVLSVNSSAVIIIKSTVPIGYTEKIKKYFSYDKIIFSPEFLREGKALHDNLYPSRIVVGERSIHAEKFASLLRQGAIKNNIDVLFTNNTEAEAIKLFANTYLAMRVAFFNELDSFSAIHGLDARQIIQGIGLDPRIGNHYNNPSFGYGGYCLPKDTKQLLANYRDVPQRLITAIVESNSARIDFIVNMISKKKPGTVGIYRLLMKSGSDNFRHSSSWEVMNRLSSNGTRVIVFEPVLGRTEFSKFEVVGSLGEFKRRSDLIIANRVSDEISDVAEKIFSRDVFTRD